MMADALAVIEDLNDRYTANLPADHLGIRVIDMLTMSITEDITVPDNAQNRMEMEMGLLLLLFLPPNYLILTNVA